MDRLNLIDLAIAPLTWLERARGRRRQALIALYLVLALIGGVFGWRELSLWRLPNAPEPFDLAKFGRVNVADADNAIPLYRVAGGRVKPADGKSYRPATDKAWDVTDWSLVAPEIRRWLEDSRPALEPWLAATERREAVAIQPEEMNMSSMIAPIQSIRDLSRMGVLEGSRKEIAGDHAGAWQMYRAVLRSSRHAAQHGGAIQRLIGQNVLKRVTPRVTAWTDRPAVTSAMLRRAIADVEEAEAMTPPTSEMIHSEYFANRDALAHTELWASIYEIEKLDNAEEWYKHLGPVLASRHFLLREPERSQRVLRLIVAGHLAQCDRPRALRPKLRFDDFMIYGIDAKTPPAVRSLTPEELHTWAENSAMKGLGYSLRFLQGVVDSERGVFENLRLPMAERAYLLDHGRPPRTYADLLGPYLKTLPEGIEPGDAVSAAASATPTP